LSKKERHFDEAQTLYVQGQHTVNEIASKLVLAEKTVRVWKAQGEWDEKRKEFLKSKSSVHSDLYEVIKSVISSVKDDLAAKQKIEASRMYFVTKALPLIIKIKDYEDLVNKKQGAELKNVLSPEDVREVEELLGLRRYTKEEQI